MKDQNGFALILMLSLLPVVLAGGLLVFGAFSFLKTDLGTLNVCRALQLETQNKAANKLTALLKLNPRALKLRLAQKRAEKSLALAMKSGNPAAIAAAEARLLLVQMQRQALDLKQRSLIETANSNLSFGGSELQRRLYKEWRAHSAPVSSWLMGSLQFANSHVPTLAVQADFVEVAPLYQPVEFFIEAQAWHQSWQIEFQTTSWAKKYFNFHERFSRSCETSIYFEDGEWSAKLKQAKPSWKLSS